MDNAQVSELNPVAVQLHDAALISITNSDLDYFRNVHYRLCVQSRSRHGKLPGASLGLSSPSYALLDRLCAPLHFFSR